MSISSDSAEQTIKLYMDGLEFSLKIAGSATKNIIAALYALSKEEKTSKGKTRLSRMLKINKELKIFSIKQEDMKIFAKQAKSYGVLYCALINKKNKSFDDMVDIMVRAEDAHKINRIIERFNLTTVDKAQIIKDEINKELSEKSEDSKDLSENNPDKGVEEKNVDDKMLDDIFTKPIQAEEKEVPLLEEIQKESQSENSLENKTPSQIGKVENPERKSVIKELEKYKNEEKLERELKKKEEKAIPLEQSITVANNQISKLQSSKNQNERK